MRGTRQDIHTRTSSSFRLACSFTCPSTKQCLERKTTVCQAHTHRPSVHYFRLLSYLGQGKASGGAVGARPTGADSAAGAGAAGATACCCRHCGCGMWGCQCFCGEPAWCTRSRALIFGGYSPAGHFHRAPRYSCSPCGGWGGQALGALAVGVVGGGGGRVGCLRCGKEDVTPGRCPCCVVGLRGRRVQKCTW